MEVMPTTEINYYKGMSFPADRKVAVPEIPPPPRARPFSEARDEVVRLLQVALRGSPASTKDSVAGWSVAVGGSPPFIAEICALVALLEALAILAVCAPLPAVHVLCDCQAALKVCESSYNGRVRTAFEAPHRSGTALACTWVRAHGRVSSGWRPPEGVSEDRARQLHAAAAQALCASGLAGL
ncbi:unnamed protein product [Symbiodinium sp. KB8]|nr:unnamed protein product [Symbiodinium sp. KB8]